MTNRCEVLRKILDTATLSPSACAAALNLEDGMFAEMLSGQRDIPDSHVPLLAAVLGVNESAFARNVRKDSGSPDVVPAIWYKLKADTLTEADREYVLTIRQLAFYQHELETITDSRAVSWKTVFEAIRRDVDPQASPTEQGRQAARSFRTSTGLAQGALGVGEVIRSHLRASGVLVLETAAKDSSLEGCSFYVGPSGEERPCIFANSYRSTWFRRNRVLMHELAHAIFDVESTIAALDFSIEDQAQNIEEQRADGFAQEALLPLEVLRNLAQRNGIKFEGFDTDGLAKLVAQSHAEQRLVLKALNDAGFIDSAVAGSLVDADIAQEVKKLSTHALSTQEFLRASNVEGGFPRRTTTNAPRKLLLPVRYVGGVLDAIKSRLISRGKAARMLMIDEYEFVERFVADQLAYSE